MKEKTEFLTAPPPPPEVEVTLRKALADRITEYLSLGGFWNPEAMEHEKVRDLLIDCRAHLQRLEAPAASQEQP